MGHGTPVADLVADPDRPADVCETLTVRREDDRYPSTAPRPGPLLEATVGDLVEVRLVNDERRRRHHPALARRRRPERRGRRGRGHPGRGRRRRGVTSTGSWPTRPGRSGTTPTRSRTSRCAGACSAPWWSTREPRTPDGARRGRGAAPLRPRRRPSTARRAPRPLDAEPGQQVRLRVVNTDNGLTPAVGDRRAVPRARRRRHRPQRARRRRGREVRPARRWPRRPRHRRPRRRRPGRLRRHHQLVLGDDPDRTASRRRPRRSSSTCCPTASPPTSASTRRGGPALRVPDRQAARLPRRPPRPVVDASTATCSPTSRCSWSARATSW